MKREILLSFVLSILFLTFSFSQSPEWVSFTTGGNYNRAFAIEGDYIWVGTEGGLVKLNMLTAEKVYYTKGSGLPSNSVLAIAIDGQGNKWIGANGGLAVYREGGVILDVYEKDKEIIPKEFALYQNYPNPFNPSTFIIFDLLRDMRVRLSVYDILDRLVRVLVDGEVLAGGRYRVEFRGDGLASGVYFYKLEAGEFVSVKKMVLVK